MTTVYGWVVEEEALPDGLRTLVCRKGNREMRLLATPDVSRETLYERGVEALLSDDAYWAAREGNAREVERIGRDLRRHRIAVATRRLARLASQAGAGGVALPGRMIGSRATQGGEA